MALDPPLPGGFGAELRDYQREGVRWLLRLAHWAPGACLADDMGLGKTVQALAVLQSRASLGPQLVVAPTSVVGNWQREAARFTPALNVQIYAEGDRTANLATLGPGSLLLLSYGLLALDIDALKTVTFATVIHDEAQALKNAQTQRAQAARQLQADFSIATTGTPIENHLGELWSLFRIIAPGLLGSQEQFSRRFALPIGGDSSHNAKAALRALIAPFILRRNKHEVLDELPSRTEVVLRVEADAEEARLQQALRKQALDRLQADTGDESRRRFNILAALTRLRRAACHPTLVAPELGLPGSKLTQLLELIEELREGGHRALIFSQFTDFLAIIRKALDGRGLRYQYLDGQTAPKARQQAVDAFQRGEGDLFLLSLKAGGVGLNLTAADYVIHLDPWWNPAIEQQATDRAHRIGQTRPVTVYKLVLADSIEEQILSLHGSKRELIDAMLAEQDGGSRLGVDDLLGLLRGMNE
ncbi:MAG: DEAD/DEAH box helicase [Xanthomonadales bacterium]|jgi:SNF2 family DNA or RNA helicase|nr:DEAD/DEAH box helicase [Xanthomonadales bacterium]